MIINIEEITTESINKDLKALKSDIAKIKSLLDDLIFSKRTEEAYQRIKAGVGIEMDFDDFINEMRKW